MSDKARRKPAAHPPITSHPLFPLTVILWFGALFGLASLAIRPALIEHMVLVAGIDRVIPMAAPPLGTTTRILLALLMTGLGCALGMIVARALAKPQPRTATRRRRAAAEGPSPVVLFGTSEPAADDQDEATDVVAKRRRQLTAAPEAEMPTEVTDEAPLPGAPPIFDVAELELESFDAELEDGPWMRRSVESQSEEDRATADASTNEDLVAEDFEADAESDRDAAPPERAVFGRRQTAQTAPAVEETQQTNRLFDAYVRGSKPREDDDAPSPRFELIPDLDSLEEEPAAACQPEKEAEPETAPIATETKASPSQEAAPAPMRSPTAAERIASAPLDELSPVELLERLALTIARRRAAASAGDIDPVSSAPQTPQPQPAPQEAMPFALRPVMLDSDASEDDALPGYAPPRHISLASVTHDRQFASAEEAQGSEAASSTSELPVRSFEAPAPRSADKTEQALRAALATLQRMSGAA